NNCEIDPCTKNPCENGGTCRLKGNSSKCDCKTPYFGDKCEKDPCTDNPCKNGGTCSLFKDSFKCDCIEQFDGDKCENGKDFSLNVNNHNKLTSFNDFVTVLK
ncbi:hypothetical protein AVEN_60836-1, partial [Araneus ventricosus]